MKKPKESKYVTHISRITENFINICQLNILSIASKIKNIDNEIVK